MKGLWPRREPMCGVPSFNSEWSEDTAGLRSPSRAEPAVASPCCRLIWAKLCLGLFPWWVDPAFIPEAALWLLTSWGHQHTREEAPEVPTSHTAPCPPTGSLVACVLPPPPCNGLMVAPRPWTGMLSSCGCHTGDQHPSDAGKQVESRTPVTPPTLPPGPRLSAPPQNGQAAEPGERPQLSSSLDLNLEMSCLVAGVGWGPWAGLACPGPWHVQIQSQVYSWCGQVLPCHDGRVPELSATPEPELTPDICPWGSELAMGTESHSGALCMMVLPDPCKP